MISSDFTSSHQLQNSTAQGQLVRCGATLVGPPGGTDGEGIEVIGVSRMVPDFFPSLPPIMRITSPSAMTFEGDPMEQ